MKDYKSYMDRVGVSEEFHQKLLDLKESKKDRVPWTRYGAIAACAALLVGVGAYGMGRWWSAYNERMSMEGGGPSVDREPVQCAAPNKPAEAIDIAPVEPGDEVEPGMKTIPGYESRETRAGVDVVAYHMLPYIEYGDVSAAGQVALDWGLPPGATQRDLTADEIASFLNGEEAVDLHLDWSAYALTGWAAWYEDGSFWGAYLYGYAGPMDHFEFAVTAGMLPPTCFGYPDSVEQTIWGVTVTADKHEGEYGGSRRVSFMKDDYGYRFDLTFSGSDAESGEQAERLVSRAVRMAIIDGLSFHIMTGEEPPAPVQTEGSSADGETAASPSRGPRED